MTLARSCGLRVGRSFEQLTNTSAHSANATRIGTSFTGGTRRRRRRVLGWMRVAAAGVVVGQPWLSRRRAPGLLGPERELAAEPLAQRLQASAEPLGLHR